MNETRRRPSEGGGMQRETEEQREERRKKTVWIGDLTTNELDETVLTGFFGHEPGFHNVKVLKDKNTGRPLGYGFIEFDTVENASHFLQRFAGQPVPGYPGRRFRLNWASFGVGRNEGGSNFSCFVGDLASDITDIVLYEVFRRHFPTCSGAKVVMDPQTGRSRGYGFVKFESEREVKSAIETMNGKFVLGRQIKVAPAVSRRRDRDDMEGMGMEQLEESMPTKQKWKTVLKTVYEVIESEEPGLACLCVSNLGNMILDEDLFKAFSRFGQIEDIRIPPSSADRRGYVKFSRRSDAQSAIQTMNGKVVKGATLSVAFGKLESKTVCVNTLVTVTAKEEQEEEKQKWKEFQYQRFLQARQQQALHRYYRALKKKISGRRSFAERQRSEDGFGSAFSVPLHNVFFARASRSPATPFFDFDTRRARFV